MATSEDVKQQSVPPEADAEAPPEAEAQADALARSSTDADGTEGEPVQGVASIAQLGTRRYVYAAYMAGAIGIAFIMSKVLDYGWYRLQQIKPGIGEPSEELIMSASALIGAVAAVYYWYRTRARELAEQVAKEMSLVTWPDRTEVTNGTFVVIVTTIISTVFFALMDKFWGFVTNLVYGGS
jgi:preprotein translocase SecE subunit